LLICAFHRNHVGKPDEADPLAREALGIYRKSGAIGASDYPAICVWLLSEIAVRRNRQLPETEQMLRDALREMNRQHPNILNMRARILTNLARIVTRQGKSDPDLFSWLVEARALADRYVVAGDDKLVLRINIGSQLMHQHLRTGRLPEAVAERTQLEQINTRAPAPLVERAAGYAECLPLLDIAVKPEERDAERKRYTDLAMTSLRLAFTNGYRDAAALRAHLGLVPLRDEPRFAEFLVEMEKPK
jgi:hypothetical protein